MGDTIRYDGRMEDVCRGSTRDLRGGFLYGWGHEGEVFVGEGGRYERRE